jgi:enoyl-CoA hydratase
VLDATQRLLNRTKRIKNMSMINVEKDGHILKIAMARPEKYNAFTIEMYHQIALAYGQLNSDPELRVGLFYGEGDHFTSGLELTDWAKTLSAGSLPPLPKGAICSGQVKLATILEAFQ